MKTSIQFSTICLMAIFSLFFTSCSSDNEGDTVKPVINLIEPTEGATLKIGNAHGVHFDMELSDDVMLKSYKVNIHSNFDGHSHTRTSEETVDFSFNRSWDVSGKNTKIHHHEIVIPENATPRNDHLMVYCTDEAGNESYLARNIVLSHDGEEYEHEPFSSQSGKNEPSLRVESLRSSSKSKKIEKNQQKPLLRL